MAALQCSQLTAYVSPTSERIYLTSDDTPDASTMQGAVCNNCTFPDAVEFISGAIENHFAAFGLNVEFVNA